MFRRTSLPLALTVLLAGSGCRSTPPAAPVRLNVVLISIDTLRADHLGAYGYTARRTSPNLDRLAADSVLFEHQIASAPWTVPSHLSLLTSLQPTAHGVTDSFRSLMGKLEGGADYERLADPVVTLAEALRASGRTTAAFTGGVTLDPALGFGQGFESYDTSMFKLSQRKMDGMLGWVESHRTQPFFLFWHTFEVHAPYLQPAFLGEVLPEVRAQRVARRLEQLSREPGQKSAKAGMEILTRHHAFTREACVALYDGGVRSMDAWLGQLLDRLRALGLYDRTLIVFTSDHGEQFGEHREETDEDARGHGIYNTHGNTLYEEMVHVPLLVKLPGQARAGTRVAAVSRAIDLMPTVLELAGAAPPAGQMQGASLRPLWEGRPDPARPRAAVSESLATPDYERKGIRTDRYKYILQVGGEVVAAQGRQFLPAEASASAEIYDLHRDPAELHNLRGQPEIANTAAALDRELRRSLEQKGRAAAGHLDAGTVEDLRALGYVQ